MSWAGFFAVVFTLVGTIGLGMASLYYAPLCLAVWPLPPNPFALLIFLITLDLIFLSHWLLPPQVDKLFATIPDYYTERMDDGSLKVVRRIGGMTMIYPSRNSTPSTPR